MSKKKNKDLRQVQACEWLKENYLQFDHIRHDIVTDRLQIKNLDSSESCRMVQSGVESSSIENTMLHNSTQPLHNATPSAHRTGIRIHAGNTIEHTTGCILIGILPQPALVRGDRDTEICLRHSRKQLEELKNYLLNYIKQNPYEEIYIQLESPDPYPDYDTPCSYEQQQHIQESLGRARELRREEVME